MQKFQVNDVVTGKRNCWLSGLDAIVLAFDIHCDIYTIEQGHGKENYYYVLSEDLIHSTHFNIGDHVRVSGWDKIGTIIPNKHEDPDKRYSVIGLDSFDSLTITRIKKEDMIKVIRPNKEENAIAGSKNEPGPTKEPYAWLIQTTVTTIVDSVQLDRPLSLDKNQTLTPLYK